MRTTVDVVLDDPDSTRADLRGMAADIRAAVDHAEQLIAALLLLARNERGLTNQEEFDLAVIAEDVLDASASGDRQLHASLDPAVVSGDPILVGRLIANLVDNAIRYSPAGGDVWISTRTVAGDCQMIVANTGALISASNTERIFEPFERLNERASHDGFGLGLHHRRVHRRGARRHRHRAPPRRGWPRRDRQLSIDQSGSSHTRLMLREPHPGAALSSPTSAGCGVMHVDAHPSQVRPRAADSFTAEGRGAVVRWRAVSSGVGRA